MLGNTGSVESKIDLTQKYHPSKYLIYYLAHWGVVENRDESKRKNFAFFIIDE